ncbi:hypothetical protein PVAND_005974 [Polypedilum vanderplanki]|uniref:EF-hand domain-containing protein n=1 Tax=Polypedilum vanderplanki TaxID=319348 RepID=A0A9J6C1Q0_POLVA|nr:hypothetical protein PVAND_005974 [Polypedilum vanderplanki]
MIEKLIFLSLILAIVEVSIVLSKGPHHPRNSHVVKRETRKQEFEEHLGHQDKEHINEDLTGMHVKHKDVNEMSDEEKSFYFFKVHDTDNNNNLDGLEMIKAALHRHGDDDIKDIKEELKHITSVVDEFLDFADLDKNGLLDFAEYKTAMTANDNSPPPLSETNNTNDDNQLN